MFQPGSWSAPTLVALTSDCQSIFFLNHFQCDWSLPFNHRWRWSLVIVASFTVVSSCCWLKCVLFVWYFWTNIGHLDWRTNRLKYEIWNKCIHKHWFCFVLFYFYILVIIHCNSAIHLSTVVYNCYLPFIFCVCFLSVITSSFSLCNTFFSDGIISWCLNSFFLLCACLKLYFAYTCKLWLAKLYTCTQTSLMYYFQIFGYVCTEQRLHGIIWFCLHM